ncbi:PTS system mannose/fructose/N-acetylgalactosamine-transporter subunit IIB [Bacillus niameyensis]|uniref:PTS system mannose/fructose/N-acetylgalactosamine-transporter subunit IIB n=1 Tax=Bacillus niameyensis TaxID=1522308 RepID=UPI0007844B56|nr:PTS sugar transporter subunit IIB [Bacillus niameyensis]
MAIVFTRVDGRLIHGQVAVAWIRNVGSEKIMVIDDEVANDEMQRMLLELAVPAGVTVEIYGLAEGADSIKNGTANKQKTMLIVKEPSAVLELVEKGVHFDSVNIGGMYYQKGKEQIDKALFVDDRDREVFNQLREKGVELFYQIAPMHKKRDLFSLLS